ncbi:MAG: MMPL family transporter [Opitutaceae bacterium]
MPPQRQKLWARVGLIAFIVLCAAWLLPPRFASFVGLRGLDYGRKISTNVLDLIPASEQSPEINLVRGFADDVQSRVMLFALRDPQNPANARDIATRFATKLTSSPEFAEAVVIGDPAMQDKLGRAVFERRFELLLPGWLAAKHFEFKATGGSDNEFSAWLAEKAAADLEAFLATPEATAMQEIVLADPLLLLPRLASQAQIISPQSEDAGGYGLVWARIKASPLAEEGQKPVFAAVEAALADARTNSPGVELRWSGINRFAAASRDRIEAEMQLLNFFSIAAVLAVSAIFVRHIYKIIHLLPVILLSIAGAWTVSTLVFDRLHILVFVIGSLLSGVAIDYGVYIYMQPPLRPEEPYAEKLRRLIKPLLASCFTTVIGFSLLLFSDLPLIRQIGLFVGAGLLCALGAAILYFAQLDRPFLAGRQFGGLGVAHRWRALRFVPRVLLVLAVATAVLGPFRLRWRDDVRELDIPSPALNANEAEVRSLFGESQNRSLYLSYGKTAAEAREHLEGFRTAWARVAPDVATSSLGLLLPLQKEWQEQAGRMELLGKFPGEFRVALERHGFSAGSFTGFFENWERVRAAPPAENYEQLARSVSTMITGPLSMLSSTRDPFWFITVVDNATIPAPAEPQTVNVSQLQSLNDLFTRYRWSALRLSLIGLGLVIASVFAIYPFRRGLRIALIPAGSCFFVFGAFGLLGHTLNLFHLLGAFLGVCLSHNYAIFSSENAGAGGAPPVSIRLSALSTATSFGVLAFSHIPVIHALGLTVALIVITTLATVELEPLARRPA